jgi:flagellar basal-body rod modification protein FlgD
MSGITGYGQNSNQIRDQYLTLLITQMQNQNPMDPMSNDQMASQLAALSQLEQVEDMNDKFDKVLSATQMEQASQLIGDSVVYRPDGAEADMTGTVKGAQVKDGEVYLNVSGHEVKIEDILGLGAAGTHSVVASDLSQAAALIGKEISFQAAGEEGGLMNIQESVRSVEFKDGRILLNAGAFVVEPHMVTGINE